MREAVRRHRRVLVFLLVGGASALIDVGVMKLLLLGGSAVLPATSAGFLCGLLFNFVFHARLTFSASMTAPRFARYLTVVLANYLLTLAIVHTAEVWFHSPVGGKLLALVALPLLSYQAGKHWIYK